MAAMSPELAPESPVAEEDLASAMLAILAEPEDPRARLEALAATAAPGAFVRALLSALSKGGGGTAARTSWLIAHAAEKLLRDLNDEEGAKGALLWGASGLLQLEGGEEPAFELLNWIFELDPQYPPLLQLVGEYHHRRSGELGEAARFYERFLELAPGAVEAASIALRLAEIGASYDDPATAARWLERAVRDIVPAEDVERARALITRLRNDTNATLLGGLDAMLVAQSESPETVERDLHRWARRAANGDRAWVARRLGRLRESRIGDLEGASLAYQSALRAEPADLASLGALERVATSEPATVLAFARAAANSAQTPEGKRSALTLASRVALRLGDAALETELRLAAMHLSPEDALLRRRAADAARRANRPQDLLEVLRAEAEHGDRTSALLAGVEILSQALGRHDAALGWAEEAHLAATESSREIDAARAAEWLDALRATLARDAANGAPHPQEAIAPPPAEPSVAQALREAAARHAAQAIQAAAPTAPSAAPDEALPPAQPGPVREADDAASVVAAAPGPPAPQPPSPEALASAAAAIERANAAFAAEQWSVATSAFEEAILHAPHDRHALERLASLYAQTGRIDDAVHAIERLLRVVAAPGERAGFRALRALWTHDARLAERELRSLIESADSDDLVLDLCAEAAKSRGLWALGAAAQERRSRI
jgi:Tfp pilus assembly protein PilF